MTHDQIDRIQSTLLRQAEAEFLDGAVTFGETVTRFNDIVEWAQMRRETACVALVEAPGGLVYVG